jgi:hypothetical protein
MAKRDVTLPEDFLKHLGDTIPGFRLEAPNHQFALGRMIWMGGTKLRRHQHFEGAMSFGHKELELWFGRNQFCILNKRLGIFKVSPNWSKENAHTKGYWLSDDVKVAWRQYVDRYCVTETRMLMASGAALKTIPAAVAYKGMRGMNAREWTCAKKLNLVKVNLESLLLLQNWLRSILEDCRSGHEPADLSIPLPSMEVAERLFDATSQIIRLAMIDVSGHGYIAQRYQQAASGRLYATGISLQSAPSLIKQAALEGLWEYDFSNCHFAILDQMAKQHGYECTAIRDYLANKEATRLGIAADAGITKDQAKTCLLAIMYGARVSEWHENAIPQAIGAEAAKRLYTVAKFKAIHADITRARTFILRSWKRTANGSLTNAFGKAILGRAKPAEQMAHLIQGVEAKALHAAVNLYPDNIVLLQHDGFASTSQLDSQAIIDAVFKATGYSLHLEESRLQVNHKAYLAKHFRHTEFKMKTVEKSMNSWSYRTFMQGNTAMVLPS